MKTDLNSMLKKFGDRITATQSDGNQELAFSDKELARMHEWANTRGPLAPSHDQLGELQMPRRPGATDSTMMPNADLLEQASWYGGRAIYNILKRRGFDCTEDDCHVVAALSHFRPFGFIDEFLTQVYERPRDMNSEYTTSLQRAIDGTEAWLQMLHESKVFQEILERPIAKADFGAELRQLGAINDPHLAPLAMFSAKQGNKVLVPGAAVALGLDHITDFYLDTLSNNEGTPKCAGMRSFHTLVSDLIRSNDPTLKEIVGTAIQREISEITAPLIGEVLANPLARYRVTGQLMFLRDGLLRLCNKHLAELHDTVKEIPRDATIGKLIELLEPSPERRESFLLSTKLDLALLSEKPKLCGLVRELVQGTPSEKRLELFQLLTTAPKLLECVEVLSSSTKPAHIVAAIPDLVRPLAYAEPPASLAQLITSYHEGGNRGLARLLYDNRGVFAQLLSTTEAHNIGHKLLFVLNVKVHEGAKGSQIAAIVSQVGATVGDHKLADADAYLDSLIGERPFITSTPSGEAVAQQTPATDTIEARQPDDTRGWARWTSDMVTSPEAKRALDRDMDRFSDTAWYKQILFTPSSLSEYISALNSQNPDLHQSILARHRAAEPPESQPQAKHSTLADFTKVIFIGGLQDHAREAKLRELMPTSCDVSFYYADASASSFRNMTALSLAGEGRALAVYLPNFTSHSMYYKACDLAEGAGAKLLVLPKGAQNPRVIVERLRDMLA